MTTVVNRRKLNQRYSEVERLWLTAWRDWAGASLKLLKAFDPLAGEKVVKQFNPLYQEWAEAAMNGQLPSFLSRGAVLAKWWPEAPALWEWLWGTQTGWATRDLRVWPSQLPEPPKFPTGALALLLAEGETAEDFALTIAVAQAQTQSTSHTE